MAGILLVHGAWHGPWCWEGMAERLRRRGHQVQAVRLRGHDRPPGRIWHRVRHYVQDVGAAAAWFAEPPLLVGHSLGALVVQKHLERGPGNGAVLLAPFPRRGRWGPWPAWPPVTRWCWPRPTPRRSMPGDLTRMVVLLRGGAPDHRGQSLPGLESRRCMASSAASSRVLAAPAVHARS